MSSPNDDAWTGPWVAEKLKAELSVGSIQIVNANLILIDRTRGDRIVVATLAVQYLDENTLRRALECDPSPRFVVNAAREAVTSDEAIRLSAGRRVPVGSLSDLKMALD